VRLAEKIVLGIAVLSLFGTVTNYVYLSPLLTLLLPACVLVFTKEQLPRSILWLYVFAALFVLSTLLYDWHSFFTFEYYRRDGNFIISYAPLLVLPLFCLKFELKKVVRYFYCTVLCLYVILFIYHFVTLNSYSKLGIITFGGLFHARNAVGGFLAVMAGLGFAYYYHRRGLKELCFFLMIFVMLVATYSRGSILGFLMGLLAWYCTITKRFKTLAVIIAIPVLLTTGSIAVGYPYYKNTIDTHSEANLKNLHLTKVTTKNWNVLVRVLYLWPQAWYLFLHSPIVGTGVGSYDDRPLELKQVMPLVSYNKQPHKVHTNRHAHHSYLMFLAEQGILGLAVFLVFWVSLFVYILKIRGTPVIRTFLLIAYFTLTFASFTEHRITTPSNMLPFTIILGLVMAYSRPVKTYLIKKTE
jgi:O-antigen ligase